MVETISEGDIMAYYGNASRPIAHFPFNFKLLFVKPEMNASEVLNLVNYWYRHLPENDWATFLVSPYSQNLMPGLCRINATCFLKDWQP